MLAVLQAEALQLVQRCRHARSRSVREPVTAAHIEVQQAVRCRALAQRPDARVRDALAAFQAQHLQRRRIAQIGLKDCRDRLKRSGCLYNHARELQHIFCRA